MTEGFHGKYFSITDPQGVNTVIYRINETAKELQNKYPKYTVERLVFSEEFNGNNKKKTFFIDYPEPQKSHFQLSLTHFILKQQWNLKTLNIHLI